MNLEEAIEHLKAMKELSIAPTNKAIELVLAEMNILQADLYSANTIIDDLVGGKEITLREGLELISKQCINKQQTGDCDSWDCRFYDRFCSKVQTALNFSSEPIDWDIDNIIKAIEKLKKESDIQ